METEKLTNFIDDIVFVDSIDRNKKYDRVSKLHKYWSRKPWYLIEKSILDYSKEGDLVLDPFIGSGKTGVVASLINSMYIGFVLYKD